MKKIEKWDGQSIEQLQEILDAQTELIEAMAEKHDAFVMHCAKRDAELTMSIDALADMTKSTAKLTSGLAMGLLEELTDDDDKDVAKLRAELDKMFDDEEDSDDDDEIELYVSDDKMDALLSIIFGIADDKDEEEKEKE